VKLPGRSPSVVFKQLSDGGVLYCSESEVYFGLNEVGVAIWESLPPLLQTYDDLVTVLSVRFPKVPAETIRSDALEFVDNLVENGLAVR
jgi:hypothetical protein